MSPSDFNNPPNNDIKKITTGKKRLNMEQNLTPSAILTEMIYTIYRNHLGKTMNHTVDHFKEVIDKARTFSECNNNYRNSDPSDNRSKETLREKCPYTKFFLVRIFL